MDDEENPPPPGAEEDRSDAAGRDEGNGITDENGNGDGDQATDANDEVDGPPAPNEKAPQKWNINLYYGHKVGLLQTLSLTLNVGLMVYTHVVERSI